VHAGTLLDVHCYQQPKLTAVPATAASTTSAVLHQIIHYRAAATAATSTAILAKNLQTKKKTLTSSAEHVAQVEGQAGCCA
jgi:hypothetical protein